MLPDRKARPAVDRCYKKARPAVAAVNRNPDLAADLQNRTTGKELARQTAPALWKRAEYPALRQEQAGGRTPGALAAGSSAGLLPKMVATPGCRPLGRLLAAGRPRIELHLWERRGGQHVCRRTALAAADFCGQGGGQ